MSHIDHPFFAQQKEDERVIRAFHARQNQHLQRMLAWRRIAMMCNIYTATMLVIGAIRIIRRKVKR